MVSPLPGPPPHHACPGLAVVRASPLCAPLFCGAVGGLMLSHAPAPRCGVVVGVGLF